MNRKQCTALRVLTPAAWSVVCSERFHIQSDWREVRGQTVSSLHPFHSSISFLHTQLMLQWTCDWTACLWMKLEFSFCRTNTMWPCWSSDCGVLVRYRSTFIDPGKRGVRMGKHQSKHGKECLFFTTEHLKNIFRLKSHKLTIYCFASLFLWIWSVQAQRKPWRWGAIDYLL